MQDTESGRGGTSPQVAISVTQVNFVCKARHHVSPRLSERHSLCDIPRLQAPDSELEQNPLFNKSRERKPPRSSSISSRQVRVYTKCQYCLNSNYEENDAN